MSRIFTLVFFILSISQCMSQCTLKFDYIVLDTTQGDCSHLYFKYAVSGGNASGYEWDYGDGNHCTCIHPKNFYNSNGTFDVCAKVRDINGCRDSMCITVKVNCQNPCDLSPIGIYSWDTLQLDCAEYEFSTFVSSNAKVIRWTYGDGDTAHGTYNIHKYKSNGTYPVRLLVQDSIQCADTVDLVLEVDCIKEVQCNFNITSLDTVLFSNDCLKVEFRLTTNSAVSKVNWDFGDGSGTMGGASVLHSYSDTGWYTLKAIAENTDHCKDTAEIRVHVACEGHTDVKNSWQTKVYLYPNPFQNYLNVSGINTQAMVIVRDATGKPVYQKESSSGFRTIGLGELMPGLYLIEVITDEGVLRARIQKL